MTARESQPIRQNARRVALWVLGLTGLAGLVLPVVWEVLGKGGPSADGDNFAALNLPGWVGAAWAVVWTAYLGLLVFTEPAEGDTPPDGRV